MRYLLITAILAMTALFSANSPAQESVSDTCAPAEIESLQAVQFPEEMRDANRKYRNTQLFGYNASEFKTAVTVYIYDKEPVRDLRQEFLGSGSEVVRTHAGTESAMRGPAKFTVAGKSRDGWLELFLWSEGETDFASFLWIGELSGKYIKIRTTYIRPEQDDQTGSAMRYAVTAMRSVASHVCEPKS